MWDCSSAGFVPGWVGSAVPIQFGQEGSNAIACLLGILQSVSLCLKSCPAYSLDGGARKRYNHDIVFTAPSGVAGQVPGNVSCLAETYCSVLRRRKRLKLSVRLALGS